MAKDYAYAVTFNFITEAEAQEFIAWFLDTGGEQGYLESVQLWREGGHEEELDGVSAPTVRYDSGTMEFFMDREDEAFAHEEEWDPEDFEELPEWDEY